MALAISASERPKSMSDSTTSATRAPSRTMMRFGIRFGSSNCSNAALAGILLSIRCSPGAIREERSSATATLKNANEDFTTPAASSFRAISEPVSPLATSILTSPIASPGAKSGALSTPLAQLLKERVSKKINRADKASRPVGFFVNKEVTARALVCRLDFIAS